MAGSPGMAGDRQGQRHRMAEGQDVSTEQNRDRWRCSVVVRACREEGTKRNKKKAKKKETNTDNTPQHHKEAGQRRTSGKGHATAPGDWDS